MRPLLISALGSLVATACGNVETPDDSVDCASVAGVLACNTFETDDPSWTTLETNGVVVIDTQDSENGDQSLRAQVSAMGGKAVRAHAVDAVDRYYARFFAKIPTGSDTTGIALLHLGEATGMFLGTNVEVAGGKLGIAVQSADVYDYQLTMPLDRWLCLELELAVSETGGRAILRADGATVVDRSGIDTRPETPINDLEVGISFAGAAGAIALIDDVVVAREPLPACP